MLKLTIVMLEAVLTSLKRISFYLHNNNAYRTAQAIDHMIEIERRQVGKPAVVAENEYSLDNDCLKSYPGNKQDDYFRGGV